MFALLTLIPWRLVIVVAGTLLIASLGWRCASLAEERDQALLEVSAANSKAADLEHQLDTTIKVLEDTERRASVRAQQSAEQKETIDETPPESNGELAPVLVDTLAWLRKRTAK
jgi:hypothetical protein